ncbi:MAG: bifunctional DNA-formamidopyrimidine glycosylase/DNA-(apurinic or apyrimidinic site) lyase [Azoarcus sp.]|jgi:formamidopyrimidine-DNA glycosylase|nr:bifunctional DNA-formamidopyrimidine glycosylase/DNA-(apurinic or apyrimidinic site) lyase [Azoarcus sp.]
MPELPEVEITCRGIRPHIEGRTLVGVTVREARLRQPVPEGLGAALAGCVLTRVGRRGKYLLFDFDSGGGVLVHLGMSGSLRVVARNEPPGSHDHVDFPFDNCTLRLHDPRRFGLVAWHAAAAASHPLLARLGPEPLGDDFDGQWLYRASRGLRVPVKHFLMDARRLAGIGNIYASECLFQARIHPQTPVGRLDAERCAALANALKETLTASLAAGGSTLRDFVGGDGRPGYFQQQHFVYGREGKPCRVCGTVIERIVSAGRAGFFCPVCQKHD